MTTTAQKRSVFITGGASGIGLAAAKHFADKGWRVGIGDIDQAALQTAQAQIKGDEVFAVILDVRSMDQWTIALEAFVTASGGRLDVLVNNAGIAPFGSFETIPQPDAERTVDINVKGVINGAYSALPFLRATKGSRLINIASCASLYGAPMSAVYSATKFAVRGLSEALDVEFAKYGVGVSCILPWFVETPILDAHTGGANGNFRDMVKASGQTVYTAGEAASVIFSAVDNKRLHHVVGAAGRRFRLIARWAPAVLRKRLKAAFADP